MVQIEKAIVSLDIFEEFFLCDLMSCKGACCVEGNSGAPLIDEEAISIEIYFPDFEKYMSPESRNEIKIQGYSITDTDGDLVTPLMNSKECIYTFIDENSITKCAIEKAYLDGIIPFRKPVSCHLFPVRITEYDTFDAVNYQQISICNSARVCGKEKKLPLYKFLKEPLIRKYGENWYKDLEVVAEHLKNTNPAE